MDGGSPVPCPCLRALSPSGPSALSASSSSQALAANQRPWPLHSAKVGCPQLRPPLPQARLSPSDRQFLSQRVPKPRRTLATHAYRMNPPDKPTARHEHSSEALGLAQPRARHGGGTHRLERSLASCLSWALSTHLGHPWAPLASSSSTWPNPCPIASISRSRVPRTHSSTRTHPHTGTRAHRDTGPRPQPGGTRGGGGPAWANHREQGAKRQRSLPFREPSPVLSPRPRVLGAR